MSGEEAKGFVSGHKHPQRTVISISMEAFYETQVLVLIV